jgi:hypothetical protein
VGRQECRGNGVGDATQFGIIRKTALYEGFGPGTVEKFKELWKKAGGAEDGKPMSRLLQGNLFDGQP